MKKTSINMKNRLFLVSVLIEKSSKNQGIDIVCKSFRDIVPEYVIDTVFILSQKIIANLTDESIKTYITNSLPLLDIYVDYNNETDFSIEIKCAISIMFCYKEEIAEILSMVKDLITIE